jgi:hypothetical protein
MAQAPFIPAQAVTDWDYMEFQWTNQSTELQWNLYDVLTDDTSLPTQPDPVYGENWAASDSFDIDAGRNDYLEGNMDLDGGGIPDEYDFALVGAVRYGTAGDGGALLFPNFQAEYDYNNDVAISDDGDWVGWAGQRVWYAGLQTLSDDWIAVFSDATGAPNSLFGHANGGADAIVGGSYDGSPDGDLDGDGLTNLQEYQANIGDPWAFALAAITSDGGGGGGAAEGVINILDFEGSDPAQSALDGCCGSATDGIVPRSVPNGGPGGVTSSDVPSGGGNASGMLTRPGPGNGDGFNGFSIDFFDNNDGGFVDASAARFFNFYLKFDATDAGAVSFNLEMRDQSASAGTDPPRSAALAAGDFTAFENYVNDEWFYVSIPLPQDGGSNAGGDGGSWVENFGRVTNAWFFKTGGAVGTTTDLVILIDHVTFTVASEDGMLGGGGGDGGTEQDASVAYRAVAGDSVCYDVTNPGTAGPGDFTWTFDDGSGAYLLEGEEDGQLCFEPLTEADAGTYVASFNDGSKADNTFTLVLEVLPEGTAVPASTNWTLFITMLAVLLSGAALMYGRNRGLGAKD